MLIPYLAADQACYAFQVAEYAKHFTCFSVDLRGAGLCSKPEGTYTTELLADDVAAFMQAAGVGPRTHRRAVPGRGDRHVAGGQAPGPGEVAVPAQRLASSDPFLRAVVEGWRIMAEGLGSVTEMVIKGIFPWCFTPELYAARPEYIDSLADFVRSRPMPPVDAFLRQSGAVLAHDARAALGSIQAPTLVTFGGHDMVTSTRFAEPLSAAIPDTELIIFEDCAHAPIYEDVDGFNQQTLAFLQRHTG